MVAEALLLFMYLLLLITFLTAPLLLSITVFGLPLLQYLEETRTTQNELRGETKTKCFAAVDPRYQTPIPTIAGSN